MERDEELVEVKTIDSFCKRKEIEKIGLIKVDTEGYDLKVLKGTSNMIDGENVDSILMEVSFEKGRKRHVEFEKVEKYMKDKKMKFCGFYDQIVSYGMRKLRFTNALFKDKMRKKAIINM